jgi:hypothetical protein
MNDSIKILFGDQEVSMSDFVSLVLQIQDHLKKTRNPEKTSILGGWVYVIKSGGYYKIGSCIDYNRRLKHYKTLPEAVEVIFLSKVYNHPKIEAELHQLLKDKIYNGEWFVLTPDDLSKVGDFLAEKEIDRVKKLGSLAEVVILDESVIAANRLRTLKQFREASWEVIEKQVEQKKDKGLEKEEKDKMLFEQVTEYCTIKGTASASDIQSHFNIGYPKAKRIITQFEQAGYLSKHEVTNSSIPRVFTPPETL